MFLFGDFGLTLPFGYSTLGFIGFPIGDPEPLAESQTLNPKAAGLPVANVGHLCRQPN